MPTLTRRSPGAFRVNRGSRSKSPCWGDDLQTGNPNRDRFAITVAGLQLAVIKVRARAEADARYMREAPACWAATPGLGSGKGRRASSKGAATEADARKKRASFIRPAKLPQSE